MTNTLEHGDDLDDDAIVPSLPGASAPPARGGRRAEQAAKFRLPALVRLLELADLGALLLAGFAGYLLRFGTEETPSSTGYLFIYLSTFVTTVSLHMAQAYRVRNLHSRYALFNSLFTGSVTALFLVLACGYLSGTLHAYSRVWLVSSVMIAAALLVLNRVVFVQVVQHALHANRLTESVIVVGANERAAKMVETILGTPHSNVRILGIFDDRSNRPIPASLRPYMLGSTNAMLKYIRSNPVDRVVVTLPWIASERINALLNKLRTVPVRIDLVPSDVVWQFPGINMERLGGVPLLTVANGRVGEQLGWFKRAEDLVISSLLLLLISPVLLLVALAIKLDSPGPVIFRQRRHGFNNEVFEVFKFRSMTVNDSARGDVVQATREDRRVTRVGKFIRRTSLDELPQLFNVLFGHMSIVGPRPHAVQHNIEFGSIISEYYARHNVKPGITGWAQVNGLRGETDTVEKMHRRVDYDLHYIEHWSFGLDIKIILMTAVAVWFDPNAY